MALVWGGVLGVHAQDNGGAKFCSPFDFPLQLSANFGELRPNHFHNGLDIKTQGVVGKPIHSIADGYVSRILVLHGGYGHSLRRFRNISVSISMSTRLLCAMCDRK